MNNSISSFQLIDQTHAQGRSQVEPFGRLVWCSSHLRFYSGIVPDFPIIGIIVQHTVTAMLLSHRVQFRFFLPPILFLPSRWEPFWHGWQFFQPNNPGLVEDCFFVSLPCTLMCPSGGFLLSSANLVTPISHTDFIAYPWSNHHRWWPLEIHQCLYLFGSEHQYNSEVSENRLSEQRVSFSEQPDADICNFPFMLQNSCRAWTSGSASRASSFPSKEFYWDSRVR